MKKRLALSIVILILAMVPTFVFADNTHNGITISGTEGTDWVFNGDDEFGNLIIKKNGVVVSGKASSDIDILISKDVKNLNLNGLDQGEHKINIGPDDEGYTLNEFTLNVSGANTIEYIDVYDFSDNGTPDIPEDDYWMQADPFIIKGVDKDKDSLTTKCDILGGETGIFIEKVTLITEEGEDESGEVMQMGITSEGGISITDSKVDVSWWIYAVGDINISNSEVITEYGIWANYFEYDDSNGEGIDEYYDITIDDSIIKSNDGIVGKDITFSGNSKVDIKTSAEEYEGENYASEGIYATGTVVFDLVGDGAYVSAVVPEDEDVYAWSINAAEGIQFKADNGLENGGTLIYVSDSAYGFAAYTIEDSKQNILTSMRVVYKRGIKAPRTVQRVYGATRYETSYATANALKEELGVDKFNTVVVVSGRNYPDALAGSYLAAKNNAPILMVDSKSSSSVAALNKYIKANLEAGGKVYILGGTAAVSKSVESGLKGYTVKRLAGKDRYETNIKVLNEAGIDKEDVLVCSGTGYADSLSCSATERPILLVGKSLTSAQNNILTKAKENSVYIIGGSSAVGYSVEKAVEKSIGKDAKRLWGLTRYETSIKVAEQFSSNADTAVITYAKNFPDGLSGGPLAAIKDAPIILTDGANKAKAANFVKSHGVTDGIALGGTAVLSDSTIKSIFNMSSRERIILKSY